MNVASRPTSLLAIVLAALVATACSSGGATNQPGGNTPTPAGTVADPGGPTTGPTEPGGGGGNSGGSFPAIADGTFATGKARVEVSGERSETFDVEGGGFTGSGATILSYGNAEAEHSVLISFLPDEASGIAVTGTTFATAGQFGKDCTVSFSRNDGGGLAGEFSCNGLDGVDLSSALTYKVNLKVSFTAER